MFIKLLQSKSNNCVYVTVTSQQKWHLALEYFDNKINLLYSRC